MTGFLYKRCGHAIGQDSTQPYPVNVSGSRPWKRFWFEPKQVHTTACKRPFSLGCVAHMPCALCSEPAPRPSPQAELVRGTAEREGPDRWAACWRARKRLAAAVLRR